MILNCEGCKHEFLEICDAVSDGYHVATTKDRELFHEGHLCLLVVDDGGKIVMS